MARFASPDVEVIYDGVDMTSFVQTINEISVEDQMFDSQSFGEIWNAVNPTGTKKMDDIVIGGMFDDVAAGPRDKWDISTLNQTPSDTPHTLVIRLGPGSPDSTLTIPVHPKKFAIKFTRNSIHEFTATLAKGRGNLTVTG